jgi:hypothetical protein
LLPIFSTRRRALEPSIAVTERGGAFFLARVFSSRMATRRPAASRSSRP